MADAELVDPFISDDGTAYVLREEDGQQAYVLWGSSDDAHRWVVGFPGDGQVELTNAATGAVVAAPPSIPHEERPLHPSEKYRLMLEQFYLQYNAQGLPNVPKLLVLYHGNEVSMFTDLFRLFNPEAWPLQYQLLELYAEKAPQKIGNIPELMVKFQGQEATLLAKLASMYNDGEPLPTPPPLSPPAEEFREKLTTFFEQANPDKLGEVELILERYAHNLEVFVQALAVTYPDHAHLLLPQDDALLAQIMRTKESPYYAGVVQFYDTHNPIKLVDVPLIIEQYAGREHTLMAELQEAYGLPADAASSPPTAAPPSEAAASPPPATTSAAPSEAEPPAPAPAAAPAAGDIDWRAKLDAFYAAHAPQDAAAVPKLLEKHAGREADVWRALHKKYKVPLPAEGAAAAPAAAVDADDASNNPYYAAARRIFEAHDPSKVGEIPRLFAKHKGKEKAVVAALEKKYGPAPPASPAVPPAAAEEEGSGEDRVPTSPPAAAADPAPSEPSVGGVTPGYKAFSGGESETASAPPSPAMSPQNAGPAHETSYRTKLTAFFAAHDPAKLGQVDGLLQRNAGKEDRLMRQLYLKYNVPYDGGDDAAGSDGTGSASPESRAAAEAPLVAYEDMDDDAFRGVVEEFFREHNPAKLDDLGSILLAYKGRNERLMRALAKSYKTHFDERRAKESAGSPGPSPRAFSSATSSPMGSPAPEQSGAFRERVLAFLREHNPEKVKDIDAFMRDHERMDEDEVMRMLARKYGVEGAAALPVDYGAKVREFYARHNPAKLDTVDGVLDRFRGREEELMAELHKRYNVPYTPAAAAEAPITAAQLFANLPLTITVGGLVYTKVIEDQKLLYTRSGSNERWQVTGSEASGMRYTAVDSSGRLGWPALPSNGGDGGGGRDHSVQAQPDVRTVETEARPEQREQETATTVESHEKEVSAEFVVQTYDGVLVLPEGEKKLAEDMLASKEELAATKRAERKAQSDLQVMKDKVKDIMGIVEMRAKLADPQGVTAKDLQHELKRMERNEGLLRGKAAAAEKMSRLNTGLLERANEELQQVRAELASSRAREQKLLQDMRGMQRELTRLREAAAAEHTAPPADYRDVRIERMSRQLDSREGLIWALSQDVLSARWSAADRGGVGESIAALTGHLQHGTPPPMREGETQTTPPPSPSTPRSPQLTTQVDEIYESSALWARVDAFYSKHNPAKCTSTTDVVKKYWGRDEEVYQLLHKQYKVPYRRVPPLAEAGAAYYKRVLDAVYEQHNPKKLASVPEILKKYAGREKEMLEKIKVMYKLDELPGGPAPDDLRATDLWMTVHTIFAKHDPDNLPNVDEYTRRHLHNPDPFIRKLQQKYAVATALTSCGVTAALSTASDEQLAEAKVVVAQHEAALLQRDTRLQHVVHESEELKQELLVRETELRRRDCEVRRLRAIVQEHHAAAARASALDAAAAASAVIFYTALSSVPPPAHGAVAPPYGTYSSHRGLQSMSDTQSSSRTSSPHAYHRSETAQTAATDRRRPRPKGHLRSRSTEPTYPYAKTLYTDAMASYRRLKTLKQLGKELQEQEK